MLNPQTGGSATLANATGPTDISPVQYVFSQAQMLGPWTAYRITAWGAFSTTGTPTLALRADLGSSISGLHLGNSGAITTPSGASSQGWRATWTFVEGAPTSLVQSNAVFEGFGGSNSVVIVNSTGSTVANPATLAMTATWGTASPSNTITCYGLLVEQLN